MADLDHNLSLADALTEPPHDIEEEVKRDFIATLEAEKFDDVVGETVDKTDYVPLWMTMTMRNLGARSPKAKATRTEFPWSVSVPSTGPQTGTETSGDTLLPVTLLRQGPLCCWPQPEPFISKARTEIKPCLLLFALGPSACGITSPCWAVLHVNIWGWVVLGLSEKALTKFCGCRAPQTVSQNSRAVQGATTLGDGKSEE